MIVIDFIKSHLKNIFFILNNIASITRLEQWLIFAKNLLHLIISLLKNYVWFLFYFEILYCCKENVIKLKLPIKFNFNYSEWPVFVLPKLKLFDIFYLWAMKIIERDIISLIILFNILISICLGTLKLEMMHLLPLQYLKKFSFFSFSFGLLMVLLFDFREYCSLWKYWWA